MNSNSHSGFKILVVMASAFVAVLLLGTVVVALKPNILGDSLHRLFDESQEIPELRYYYQIVSSAQSSSPKMIKHFGDHWVRIDVIGWNEERTTLCVVYTIRVPQKLPLILFGDTIDQVKGLAGIRLQDEHDNEYPEVNNGLGFATDVVDTASFFSCFQDIPKNETHFTLFIGDLKKSKSVATFAITKPQSPCH